jgi:hypothetical protein
MDGLNIVNSWVQAIENNTTKENNNEEDLNGANNIIYIGQPMVKDLKNLAELNKLIRRLL